MPQSHRTPWTARFARLCRNHWRTIVVCLALIVLIAILQDVLFSDIVRMDQLAYWLVVLHMRTDWLTPVMTSVTNLAAPVPLLVMLVIVAAFAPGRRPGWCCALNLVLVVALNELLKHIVHRPRPDGFRLISEVGYSFPSGHSMVSMAFFGLLVWMIWRYERDRTMRVLWSLFFGAVIFMVGFSRIYLGVHYASDVVAGFCVSLVWLAFYTRVVAPLFLPKPANPRHSSALAARIAPPRPTCHPRQSTGARRGAAERAARPAAPRVRRVPAAAYTPMKNQGLDAWASLRGSWMTWGSSTRPSRTQSLAMVGPRLVRGSVGLPGLMSHAPGSSSTAWGRESSSEPSWSAVTFTWSPTVRPRRRRSTWPPSGERSMEGRWV